MDFDADSGVAYVKSTVLDLFLHGCSSKGGCALLMPAQKYSGLLLALVWHVTAFAQGRFKKLAGVMCHPCWHLWTNGDAEAPCMKCPCKVLLAELHCSSHGRGFCVILSHLQP